MSAQIIPFPARFSLGEEIVINSMLKAGNGIGGVRPKAKLLWGTLCDDGHEARMELIFNEVERRAHIMLEAGYGHF